jgi:hypothetical protein
VTTFDDISCLPVRRGAGPPEDRRGDHAPSGGSLRLTREQLTEEPKTAGWM